MYGLYFHVGIYMYIKESRKDCEWHLSDSTSFFPFVIVEEFYGSRHHSGSFSLIDVGSGLYCLRGCSFFFSTLLATYTCTPSVSLWPQVESVQSVSVCVRARVLNLSQYDRRLHLCQYDRRWRVPICVCVCLCESTQSESIWLQTVSIWLQT